LHSVFVLESKLTVHARNLLLFNPLNAELNPVCHLLAFLGDETIVRLRVKFPHGRELPATF